jgi:hypothetical protein
MRFSQNDGAANSASASESDDIEASPRGTETSTRHTDWPAQTRPQGIRRVPTHAVGRASERRAYVRARLALPLRVQRVAGQRDVKPIPLRTQDISSSGLYFLSPQRIEIGTPIEVEVLLVDRPGRGTVRMCTAAHIVRADNGQTPGWHGLAAIFDDISFRRDERVPERHPAA